MFLRGSMVPTKRLILRVLGAHARHRVRILYRAQTWVGGFVDHCDFFRRQAVKTKRVALGAFGDGDDRVGAFQKVRHRAGEKPAIERQVIFGKKLKDQIVQSENRFDIFQARQQMFGRVKNIRARKRPIERRIERVREPHAHAKRAHVERNVGAR